MDGFWTPNMHYGPELYNLNHVSEDFCVKGQLL